MDDCGNIAFTGLWCTDGTCAEATVAEVGEACTFPMGGTLCAGSFSEKATCELDMADPSAGGTCVAYPIVGEACDDKCFESFCGEDGVCTAFRAIGEACTYGECGPDADCDGDTMDDMVCTAWDDGEDEDMAMCTEPEVTAGTE